MTGLNTQTLVINRDDVKPDVISLETSGSITSEQIQDWLVNYLAALLDISTDDIEIEVPFDVYGLDSSAAIGLTGDLEEWLGTEVDPTVLYDYPTIAGLVGYLEKDLEKTV